MRFAGRGGSTQQARGATALACAIGCLLLAALALTQLRLLPAGDATDSISQYRPDNTYSRGAGGASTALPRATLICIQPHTARAIMH